jgi:hypothetical protein
VFGNVVDLPAELLLLLRSGLDEMVGGSDVARWLSLGMVGVVGPGLQSEFDECGAKSSGRGGRYGRESGRVGVGGLKRVRLLYKCKEVTQMGR